MKTGIQVLQCREHQFITGSPFRTLPSVSLAQTTWRGFIIETNCPIPSATIRVAVMRRDYSFRARSARRNKLLVAPEL